MSLECLFLKELVGFCTSRFKEFKLCKDPGAIVSFASKIKMVLLLYTEAMETDFYKQCREMMDRLVS